MLKRALLLARLIPFIGIGFSAQALTLSGNEVPWVVASASSQQQEFPASSQTASRDSQPVQDQTPVKEIAGQVATGEPVVKTPEEGIDPPPSLTQTTILNANPVDVDIGWLNLNQLLESPHRNSYLWATLTLLGILTLVAGLKIQGRKTAFTLSALPPNSDMAKLQIASSPLQQLELPADIAALSLDLDPRSIQSSSEIQSPASTKS